MDVLAQNITKPVIKKDQADDSYKIQPTPLPVGKYPYHLDFPNEKSDSSEKKLVFNMVGDTGGIKSPTFQRQIAEQMGQQVKDGINRPQFLFHLGDIVYHFGEREQYERQFFRPYANYPGPIFAIPGNHDADVNVSNPTPYKSLDAFKEVFCDPRPEDHYFSEDVSRMNQHQPHVYWTLNTELATIIGLYSNVPKFGYISPEQRDWFISELKSAGELKHEKAIIVCLHHAPYSADTNHGSSLAMIQFLEGAFAEAGVLPDIVFSGHVHNYQRFSKNYEGKKTVPFIVAGGGGFDELHLLAANEDPLFTNKSPYFEGVQLENSCLNQHGFLKVILEKKAEEFKLTCEYYTMAHDENSRPVPAKFFERFTLDLNRD